MRVVCGSARQDIALRNRSVFKDDVLAVIILRRVTGPCAFKCIKRVYFVFRHVIELPRNMVRPCNQAGKGRMARRCERAHIPALRRAHRAAIVTSRHMMGIAMAAFECSVYKKPYHFMISLCVLFFFSSCLIFPKKNPAVKPGQKSLGTWSLFFLSYRAKSLGGFLGRFWIDGRLGQCIHRLIGVFFFFQCFRE